MPYARARAHCQALGGDLASIHSAAENEEAHRLTEGRTAYIGLNDIDSEGTWAWSGMASGAPPDHSFEH
eukprot:4738729-Prymnesium_polylepis.1